MNRMFRTKFHNGSEDLKPIVTMSIAVNENTGKKEVSLVASSKLKQIGFSD
jgi:hypothetical protein